MVMLDHSGSGIDIYWIHNDHLGRPLALTDEAGDVVWRLANTDSFGNAASIDEDPDNNSVNLTFNLRFPGQYFDQETDLHYNYFRYYDPSIGRYIESDPIGLKAGLNTYLYATGNPLSFVDFDGLDSTSKSPNPSKPKISLPNVADVVCGGVDAMEAARQKSHQRARDVHEQNMRRINESCEINYQNCKYKKCIKDFQECVKRVTEECKKQQESEYERYRSEREHLDSAYPVNHGAKEACSFIP